MSYELWTSLYYDKKAINSFLTMMLTICFKINLYSSCLFCLWLRGEFLHWVGGFKWKSTLSKLASICYLTNIDCFLIWDSIIVFEVTDIHLLLQPSTFYGVEDWKSTVFYCIRKVACQPLWHKRCWEDWATLMSSFR